MKATEAKLLSFLQESPQFVIPIYQRTYSWTDKQSPLKLNAGLGQLDAWNEAAIQNRAGRLADQALAVWAAPTLDTAALGACQPEKVPGTSGYTIDDHPHLAKGSEMYGAVVRDLFEALRSCSVPDITIQRPLSVFCVGATGCTPAGSIRAVDAPGRV